MKQLKRISLVQFYLHEAIDIEIEGSTAFLGPNGSGKSSTLDAIQIAMLGGNQQYARYNSQSVSSKQRRSLTSYCLGMLRNSEKDSEVIGRARNEARTYIILVFSDGTEEGVFSAGICVEADIEADQHEIKGLFVLPGQNMKAADCIVYDGDDRRPMPFPEFRENTRESAKKIGRTAIFTDKSSEYVSELLYALNGERMPNARRFMSSFVKSMTLKNVDSIDQFVREYVVEPNPVDIAAFRKQVEQFVALRDLIVKTKARISRLTGICSDFDLAQLAERRIASLEAIRAVFNTEWLCEKVDDMAEQIEALNDERQLKVKHAELAKSQRDLKHQEVTDLKVRLEVDQDEQMRIRLEEQISSRQELIEAYQQPSIVRANRLVNALRDLVEDHDFSAVRREMNVAIERLVESRSDDNPGTVVEQALRRIANDIATIRAVTDSNLKVAITTREAVSEELDAIRRRIDAVSKTGRLLNDGAALLLELLGRAGIKAQPVSALARISNQGWASALEGYLGSDRDALVVTEGSTRDAVKILREARKRSENVDGAAVVQPHHLSNVDTESKSAEFAVSIIETENDTARRFLWNKLSSMRLVDTEEELEIHPQCITRDGMISQGGLTKSTRIASVSDLRLGKGFEDAFDFSREVADLRGQYDMHSKRIKCLETLANLFSAQDEEVDGDDSAAAKLVTTVEEKKNAIKQLAALDVSHLEEVRAYLKEAVVEYKSLDEEYANNDRLVAGFSEQIKGLGSQKQELDNQLPAAREAENAVASNPLVNAELMDKLKDEIERLEDEYAERLKEVEKKLANNERRLHSAEENAFGELTKYVLDERLDVQLGDMHWHERFSWASDEKNKLSGTELHKYEAEAEKARQASEETLRSDIAMSLHDRFREMEFERRDRNKILDSCPAFTGGERYQFIANVVPHYESLVRYINQIAKDDQTLSLFADDPSEINETLRELVDAAAETGNAGGVLDYRQFYNFDLAIIVDGKRVDRMSNRQGAGSNGEHIAPMYVAAGAALAKAYRLHSRKGQQNSTGLICLDEAFHGMDTTNAVATARFLQNIGLQLIMAGPELERTKLAPITQTIYDLDREDFDLLMECTKFKSAANSLMVSDMPGENPQVMVGAYEQLGLEPPPEPAPGEQPDQP